MLYSDSYIEHDDATFIAACAGSAEAGWRATVVAIDALLEESLTADGLPDISWYGVRASDALDAIIAAWPEEML